MKNTPRPNQPQPSTAYRTRTIKRERRSHERIEQLDRQIIEVLRADHPQSVRHVFYRMTDPRLPESVEKSDRGYRHVQDRCVKLRRAGTLPYGWITDATRRGYFTNTYTSGSDFLRSVTSLYRADLWQQAKNYVEVWVESRSIAGIVQDLCSELAVSLYPAGGFSSLTLAFEAAGYINDEHRNRPVTVLYVGDYDQAGVLVDVSIERELREHLHSDIELSFQRVGITEEQIKQYDLPTKPRKETDRRSPQVAATVEAEAMPADILRKLLRSQIEALLPADALRVARVAEESERQGLRILARTMEEDDA